MAKVISAAEAAALIGDGMTVAVDGFIGFSLAEDILCEMEERFLREGHPRDLRLVNVAGLGGDGRRRGINHFAHRGMLSRLLCSNLSLANAIYPHISAEDFALFMAPQGVMSHMMRAIAGKKPTVTISQLATAADVSPRRVENDLEQMVQKGFWGKEAYLDLGQGVLVRTFEAAEDLEQAQKKAQPIPEETREGYSGQLRDIRYANDRIADPVISAKIDRLEDLAGKIFRIVEEEPAKKAKASTFLNYYLPTTQKLLDSYADFEESGVSGENVSQAKQRIASTMDNIVAGFERQLDQLYQSDAMDVDSDIRVMEQMLRRDSGSVAEDFGLGAAVQQEEE